MLVRKTVTALFCDVSDSTGLGERLDPESHRRVVTRYFDEMRAAIERHGGTVEKFIGDAVMALFGVPAVHEDDALRAVRAAVDMRRRVDELNEELEQTFGVHLDVSIGVNTGEVVVGGETIGGTLATGDAITVAARLQQVAQPGEILIGTATYPLVRDAVNVGPAQKYRLKGKSEEVATWRLDRVDARAAGIARRLDAPLVNRVDELRKLHEAFDSTVRDQACRLVTVLGPAGIGKSRLAGELLSMLDERASAVTGRCLPYGEGITYWPLVEIVRTLGERSLEEVLAGRDDADSIARLVRGAIGESETSRAPEETFWAVRRLLEAVAEQRPLVVCLEDIHWAEPTLLDLIEYLADWSRGAPILLLCLARADLLELRPTWLNPRPNADVLVLEPLSESDADALVESLRGDVELDADARVRIARAGEGNPLFVEQMVALIAEDPAAVGWAAVPASIQALLHERLDRLSPQEREVIEHAALIGREFPHDAVGELSSPELYSSVPTILLALVRRGLLAPDFSAASRDDGYRFRHMLIRDAAYESMPREVRAVLHERLANWMERTMSERASELDEILGYHLEQAYVARASLGSTDGSGRVLGSRAAEHLGSAGRRALARGDVHAAASLLERATRLLDAGVRRAETLLELAVALRDLGELGRAESVLAEAEGTAAAAGDERLRARARVEQSQLHLHVDPAAWDDALPTAEEAVEVLARFEDDAGLARAWTNILLVHYVAGRVGEMERAAERALDHAGRADDQRQLVVVSNALLRAALIGPTPVPAAIARCEELVAGAPSDHALRAIGASIRANLIAMVGRFDEARQLVQESRAILEELGNVRLVATLRGYSGAVELLAGDARSAEAEFRAGLEALECLGDQGNVATAAALLAQALAAQAPREEARELAQRVQRTAATNDVTSQVSWRLALASLELASGSPEEALGLAMEAEDVAERTDWPMLQGDVQLCLGGALLANGRADEAAEALEHALERYESKGNLVSADRAREALMRAVVRA